MSRRLEPGNNVRERVAATSYGQFLKRLGHAADVMPRRFPPKFVERYTVEQSRNHFRASWNVTQPGLKERLKARLLKHPRLLSAVRFARKDRGILRKTRALLNALIALIPPRYSAFERVLADYGFVDVAELVREKRLRL